MESIVKMGVKSSKDKNPGNTGAVGRTGGMPLYQEADYDVRAVGPEDGAGEKKNRRVRESEAGGFGEAGASPEAETGKKGSNRQVASGNIGENAEGKAKGEKKDSVQEEKALMRSRRRHYGLIARYVIATVVITVVLVRLTNDLGPILAGIWKAIGMVSLLLMPLFWGFVFAYILAPVVGFFEKGLRKAKLFRKKPGSRHGAAVAITGVLTILVLGLLLSIVASTVTNSLKLASVEDIVILLQSIADMLKSFQKTLTDWFAKMNISSKETATALKKVGEFAASYTSGLSSSVTGTIGQIGGMLTSALFVIIFTIYFLLDGKGLKKYWNRVLVAVGGKKVRRAFHRLAVDADAVFSGYIRGQLIDAFIMAILVSVSLQLIGVKYAVIIGVLSGIGNLIPYLGPVVAYGSTGIVCILTGDLRRLLVGIVVLFVIQTIDGNVINPRLLSSSIDVHPMLVIAALIVGGAVGGLVGMLFAVPVAAFLKIQFDKLIDNLIKIRAAKKPAGRSGKKRRKKRIETVQALPDKESKG